MKLLQVKVQREQVYVARNVQIKEIKEKIIEMKKQNIDAKIKLKEQLLDRQNKIQEQGIKDKKKNDIILKKFKKKLIDEKQMITMQMKLEM